MNFKEKLTMRSSKSRAKEEIFASILCALVFITLFIGWTWFSSANEAAAFNRFTNGPRATTWDAVWLELRVEACHQ